MYGKGQKMYSILLLILSTTLVLAGQYDLNTKDKKEKEKEALSEENPSLFEGDIIMSTRKIKRLTESKDARGFFKRASLADISRHWSNGIVPYVIAENMAPEGKGAIRAAIQHIERYTCIKLVPRRTELDFVRFIQGAGCYSSLGRIPGGQDISIGIGCYYIGPVVHEILHALGFFHEQSRLDRDEYITIHKENIISGTENNFNKYERGEGETYGEKYDTDSIMHYGEYYFSKNGKPTITVKDSKKMIGQRQGLSVADVRLINRMYCSGSKVTVTPPCTDKFTNCPDLAPRYCKYPGYESVMQVNCCKSCKDRGSKVTPAPPCTDKFTNCPDLAPRYCKYPGYESVMQVNCCKSCKDRGNLPSSPDIATCTTWKTGRWHGYNHVPCASPPCGKIPSLMSQNLAEARRSADDCGPKGSSVFDFTTDAK